MKVIHPGVPLHSPLSITGPAETIFREETESTGDFSGLHNACKAPVFLFDDTNWNVLLRDLALLWRHPSSYQVLARMSNSGVRQQLKRTTIAENRDLVSNGLLTKAEADKHQFYLPLAYVLSILVNRDVLVEDDSTMEVDGPDVQQQPKLAAQAVNQHDENRVSLNQVLPQYGDVAATLELNFATFNSLNRISKFNYYKTMPMYQRLLPPSKLPPADLELLAQENDYRALEVPEPAPEPEKKGPAKRGRKPLSKKPLGKFRKYYTSIDPNTLDLTESLIPGQGYIQEFNINHLCKIPNYYTSRGTQAPAMPVKKPDTKVLKSVQLLANPELDTTLNKYYYTKSHRGVGSGNYKDASYANKLNRIPAARSEIKYSHKNTRQLQRMRKTRGDMYIKGLVHEVFHNKVVKEAVAVKRDEVDDASNIEMLHAALQYNVLVNSYREISLETWDRYYEFKMTDFDQLATLRREQIEKQQREAAIRKKSQDPNAVIPPELLHPRVTVLNNIVTPSTYPEITNKLPLDLRNLDSDTDIQPIKKPIRLTTMYPNPVNPDLAFNVESVRAPNSNSLGWDNMKKYGNPI